MLETSDITKQKCVLCWNRTLRLGRIDWAFSPILKLPLNQRLTWKVRLAKLCLSCLRTLVFCLLLDCIHAHSKCILRMNASLWFPFKLSKIQERKEAKGRENRRAFNLSRHIVLLQLKHVYTIYIYTEVQQLSLCTYIFFHLLVRVMGQNARLIRVSPFAYLVERPTQFFIKQHC